jgi:hypothetical protein
LLVCVRRVSLSGAGRRGRKQREAASSSAGGCLSRPTRATLLCPGHPPRPPPHPPLPPRPSASSTKQGRSALLGHLLCFFSRCPQRAWCPSRCRRRSHPSSSWTPCTRWGGRAWWGAGGRTVQRCLGVVGGAAGEWCSDEGGSSSDAAGSRVPLCIPADDQRGAIVLRVLLLTPCTSLPRTVPALAVRRPHGGTGTGGGGVRGGAAVCGVLRCRERRVPGAGVAAQMVCVCVCVRIRMCPVGLPISSSSALGGMAETQC